MLITILYSTEKTRVRHRSTVYVSLYSREENTKGFGGTMPLFLFRKYCGHGPSTKNWYELLFYYQHWYIIEVNNWGWMKR
jgi:hypothetical protein